MPIFKKNKKSSSRGKKKEENTKEVLTIQGLVNELGIAREGVITSYDAEENPDNLGPETYIQMQENDGEVQAIVRILTLPIISTPIRVIPDKNDKGEADFIETVFTSPYNMGGMTTPLPFIIADMTRAVSEGFRLYEKVARIIPEGDYKGMVGWKKLAPRDAQTVELKADKHGGFDGAHQQVVFGNHSINVDIPREKCMLFTFQKEKHWLYGESILKTAYYHYDKKHKLYYIVHKKAEIDATGLKILKINNTMTDSERTAAESAVDSIGINSRVTLPPGIELEITRGGDGGYDALPLIDHHDTQMVKSALTQAMSQAKYAYPYGKGTPSSQYLVLALQSIMSQMEVTLNTYSVAPLIDFNYKTKAYPQIKFDKLSDASQIFLREVFDKIMKSKEKLPEGFVQEVVNETAKSLKLKWAFSKEKIPNKKALMAFEKGKLKVANDLSVDAPSTPRKLKEKLLKVESGFESEQKCYKLGEKFAQIK